MATRLSELTASQKETRCFARLSAAVTRARASRPAPTRPRALETRHDLAIVDEPRELLESAADCRRIEGVSLTGDDALHVEDVAGTAGHALVDHQVLGGAEPYDPLLPQVVIDGPADRLFFEARQRQAQVGPARPRSPRQAGRGARGRSSRHL